MNQKIMRIGIIGGGLMGREVASAVGRWMALRDMPVRAELTGVCDLNPAMLDWFRQVPTVRHFLTDYHALLQADDVDVVYAAVPHHLHEKLYLDIIASGKALLAEKPFGIDLAAARRIAAAAAEAGVFVRCSSEFPFLPGAKRAYEYARAGDFGRLLEVRSGFCHSSDLDPNKAANWKRQVATCGEIGVMGDLGMHAVHLPLRLGWKPASLFAQLQKGYPERPDGKGGTTACETWDNAMVHGQFHFDGESVPIRLEMKRLAPGETNTWFFEALGTDGGVRFTTKHPKTLELFQRDKEQWWRSTDLGHQTPYPTITGGIFETGFPDCILQMWAAFAMEWAGETGDHFTCATPEEAVASHEIFAAALQSHLQQQIVPL